MKKAFQNHDILSLVNQTICHFEFIPYANANESLKVNITFVVTPCTIFTDNPEI
jgi:hypothetical protein